MGLENRTVLVDSGFGERPYTKPEFISAWMKPVYDTSNLLLSSEDKEDRDLANKLVQKCKKLAADKFERLYEKRTQKTEAGASEMDPSAPASFVTDELNQPTES
ncbi:MAG: hypothetical protein WED82_02130 [Balneolales bacterium]